MIASPSSPPAWFLDELAHAGPEHLDPGYVRGYERKAGLDVAAELERLRQVGLSSGSTLIDMGAGTGAVAFAAASVCRRVVAVDVSPVMVEQLRARAEGAPNLEVVQAGLLSYAHAGDPADFVYARHCLHQLPDFWKAIALGRMARMLRPGGILRVRDLLLSCAIHEVPEVIEAWLAGASVDPARGWTRAELETHLREEYSTFTWLFEPMLTHAGFRIVSAEYADSRLYATYTCERV